MDWVYLIEVLVGGLMSGVMYSLVAIGFVLIYKSSGIFNFAQGTMLLFASLTFVKMTENGIDFWRLCARYPGCPPGRSKTT